MWLIWKGDSRAQGENFTLQKKKNEHAHRKEVKMMERVNQRK